MAVSGAVMQARSPTYSEEGESMATLRIRTTELQRMVDLRFPSEEQFIREASISRTAWKNLRDPKKQRVDLQVLARVLNVLNAHLADILAYDPDEKAD